MVRPVVSQAFLILSMQSKLHKQLDSMPSFQRTMQTLEEKEIYNYANDLQFFQLEELKKELLAIKFLEKHDT